jgi:penicillin amidase
MALVLIVSAARAQETTATIMRDAYGVPHVYGDTLGAVYYGYGYAAAQDRLYQLEMFRRTYWGRLSEVYGDALLVFDKAGRRDNLTRAEVSNQIASLDPEAKTVLKAFAAGINAYITEALADKANKLPKEFQQFGFSPEFWTPEDVAADFFSVMGLFMDLTGELSNADMLNYLVKKYGQKQGQVIFNDWCWGLDPDAPTTIFDKKASGLASGTATTQVDLRHPMMASTLKASRGAHEAWVKERVQKRTLLASVLPYGHPSSYCVVIGPGKSVSGEAMLMGGPQFHYQLPSALYEVGLHGGGVDAVGSTLAGYPFIMFGHNRKAAFSSTAGADNIEDVFAEKLNPSNPAQYLFNGKYHDMTVRTEVFNVKGAQPVVTKFFYTVHGPVFYTDQANHVAFTKQLSCKPRFLQGFVSFYRLMKAETVDKFNEAAQLSDMSINYFFADTEGDIAYYHLGLYPIRAKGVDDRLPTPGTGEFEWRGFLPKDQNPHEANPPLGFLVNWNNQPEPGWRSGDLATTDVWGGWGIDNRVTNILRLVEARGAVNRSDLKDIIKTIAFYDKRAINIKDLLLEAVARVGNKPQDVQDALKLVEQWNNLSIDENPKDGCPDQPGAAIFDMWWTKAVEATFGEWFQGWTNPLGQSAIDVFKCQYLGDTLFYRALNGTSKVDYFKGKKAEIIYGALQQALKQLAGNYCQPAHKDQFFPLTVVGNFMGQPITSTVGDLPPFPLVDRGTENHIVTLTPGHVLGENITAPGTSGFIAPDGTRSPHFSDQVPMFVNFTYKPMLFTEQEVNGALETKKILKYQEK